MKNPPFKPLCSLLSLGLFLWLGPSATANVTLPAFFSDHMVLQRGVPVPIWGWAEPGEKVTISIAGQTQATTADAAGKWNLKTDPISADRPLTLTVRGQNTIVVQDVLAGEVWLASGQSNMQLPVNAVTNAWQERATAKFPQIRMFTVGRHPATTPQTNCEGRWVICSPDTVGNFSAAAYFFAREVQQSLKAPVGLLHASWGGTPIETWTSLPAMQDQPELTPVFQAWQEKMRVPYDESKAQAQYVHALESWTNSAAKLRAAGRKVPPLPQKPAEPRLDKNYPANLFNGMIAPLIPYAIRGVIWYQGENNAAAPFAALYARQLPLLIQDWRQRWGEGDFPFAWVQLPNFKQRTNDANEFSGWSVVREAMLKTLVVKNTGMAVTIDSGEATNIHPKNKQVVGHRLALWALATVYGQHIPYSGPLPAGAQFKGDQAVLSFTHTDGGLVAKDGELKGFALAGADRRWTWAQARIDGDQVIVTSPEIKSPVAVRYAWANNPDGTLYNGAGLPASPFRTDDWNEHF